MLARGHVVAHIHQRNRIVKVFFRRFELVGRRALQMLVADVEVNRGAVGQFLAGAADHLLKMRLRLVELMLLHRAQAGFVALQGLRIAGIFRTVFFAVGF